MKAQLQIYTGDGKGKTTAAIGLAIRALGAGKRVYFAQFMKLGDYSEIIQLKKSAGEGLTLRQFGSGRNVADPIDERDHNSAAAGIDEAEAAISGGGFDIVVLDEFNMIVHYGLVSRDRTEILLGARHPGTELVLTGRGAPGWLLEKAGLVTEMVMRKHYFEAGVPARKGIEF